MNKTTNKADEKAIEPEFLEEKFEIEGQGTFLYNFNELPGNAVNVAIRNYKLYNETLEHLPESSSDLKLITNSNLERGFYSALFIKLDENGKQMKYEEADPQGVAVYEAKGKKMHELRERCKYDFLSHTGLINEELVRQSSNLIKQFQGLNSEQMAVLIKESRNYHTESSNSNSTKKKAS